VIIPSKILGAFLPPFSFVREVFLPPGVLKMRLCRNWIWSLDGVTSFVEVLDAGFSFFPSSLISIFLRCFRSSL